MSADCSLAMNLGRVCQCRGAVAVVCSVSMKLSRNFGSCSQPSLGFRRRVAGEVGVKRVRHLCVVMVGQREGEETGIAGRRFGNGSEAAGEGLQEELLVSSLVDEAPQVKHLHFKPFFSSMSLHHYCSKAFGFTVKKCKVSLSHCFLSMEMPNFSFEQIFSPHAL